MSKLTQAIFKDGEKVLPDWLILDRDLSHTSPKNEKNLKRSMVYYYKKWLTCHPKRTDFKKIDFIYQCCAELNEIFNKGVKPNDPNYFVVDHIVPISSAMVCGLEVDWNLAIITNRDNERKSNQAWPDQYIDRDWETTK